MPECIDRLKEALWGCYMSFSFRLLQDMQPGRRIADREIVRRALAKWQTGIGFVVYGS